MSPPEVQPTGSRRSAARATWVVMGGILASRVLGLVREQVVALYFGRSGELSAYWAAFKIPNLFRVLAGEGNLSASFIPVLSGQLARGETPASRRTADVVLGFLLLGVGIFTVAGILLAPLLAVLAAPGFDEPLRELVTRLIRILFPVSAFLVLGAWCMGVLHAHGRFFWPNFAPVFLSLVSALSLVLLLGRWRRDPIELLAWGTVAGGLVQLLVQLPESRQVLEGLRPRLDLRDPGFRRVLVLFGPMLLGTGVAQINSLVETQIASFLDPEAVSTLQYAVRLYTLPLSLFGTSVAMAALPALSRESAGASVGPLGEGVADAWLRSLFFLIPSMVALAGFGRPLVTVIFERGAFTAEDSAAVTRVLAFYSLGLAAFATVRILSQAFYALHDSRTPTRLSILALILNTALSALLAWRVGTPGIALASTLAAFLSAGLLGWKLTRRIGPGWLRDSAPRVAALLCAGGMGAVAGLLARGRVEGALPSGGGLASRLAALVTLYGAIGLAYLVAARVAGFTLTGHDRRRG
ncbi:MAG TPA: murein biosynthesis integral membrane protein MurJ [Gemmatimonadota bacterium]